MTERWGFAYWGYDFERLAYEQSILEKNIRQTTTTESQYVTDKEGRSEMMREFFDSFFVKVVFVFIGLFISASVFAAGTQITTEGIQFPDGTLQTTKATGVPGPQGPEGPQGPQGPQGPPGTIEGPVSGLEVNVSDSTNGILAQFNNISNNNGAQILLKQSTVAWGVGQPVGSSAFAF